MDLVELLRSSGQRWFLYPQYNLHFIRLYWGLSTFDPFGVVGCILGYLSLIPSWVARWIDVYISITLLGWKRYFVGVERLRRSPILITPHKRSAVRGFGT